MSYLYASNRKYLVSSAVFDKHYRPEFMKQVLPRFCKPQSPRAELFLNNLSRSKLFRSSMVNLLFSKS